MDRYTLKLYFQDNRSKAEHLILIIKSCCDDNTRYTIALLIKPLITKVQWSLVLSGDLPLIKKSVANTNSVPFLLSTADQNTRFIAWSNDHAITHICAIITYTLTIPHIARSNKYYDINSETPHNTRIGRQGIPKIYRHENKCLLWHPLYSRMILHMYQSNVLQWYTQGSKKQSRLSTVSYLSKCYSALSSFQYVDTPLSVAKYYMTNVYNSVGEYILNSSKISNT